MPEISVPWGESDMEVSIPSHWRLQQVAKPELPPAPDDWADRLVLNLTQGESGRFLGEALNHARHGRVVLVVEDVTRHSPLPEILPLVLREIHHSGIRNDQIEIFFANGMHPPVTRSDVERKLDGTCSGISWRCNQYDNPGAYVSLGEVGGVDILLDRGIAEADLRIIVSSVSPHLQAGFGGGYKMVFPGCANIETIRGLHRKGVHRRVTQLIGMDVAANPMRRVIDAAGIRMDKHYGRTFAIHYLMDGRDRPSLVAAGDVLATHRMMTKQCSVACGVLVAEPSDVVIANAHPRDFDLWQSFKCIANTRWAARPGGIIICMTRCEAGVGGMSVPPWFLGPKWTRRIVGWLGPESLSSIVMRLIPRLAGDAAFFVRMAAEAIDRNPIFIVSAKLYESGTKFPGVPIFGDLDRAVAATEALLGTGPKRTIVFPSGGVTFPVPRAAGG